MRIVHPVPKHYLLCSALWCGGWWWWCGCRAYAAASTPTMRLKVDNSGQGGSGKLGLPAVQCIIQKIHKHEKYTNTSQVDNTAKVGEI